MGIPLVQHVLWAESLQQPSGSFHTSVSWRDRVITPPSAAASTSGTGGYSLLRRVAKAGLWFGSAPCGEGLDPSAVTPGSL